MGTETVTVMFTDLVASTEMAARVGPDAAEELRREHFSILRNALAEHGGREVKNLGDGLMVAFPGVQGALEAAAAMQQALELRNRTAAEPLEIRVGLSMGEADVDGDDYFGAPVVEAARLCDRAEAGQVLVTDLVTTLAGSRGGHTFTDEHVVTLKGLDAPTVTHALAWRPLSGAASSGVDLPTRLTRRDDAIFVGRRAEQESFVSAMKDAHTDAQRRLVLVGGEPGIGKTTLISRIASAAHDDGVVVTYGRCDEDLAIPYQPWREALSHLAEQGIEEAATAHDLLADARDLEAAGGGESGRYELYRTVLAAFAALAADRPVLLVLDDLHWADTPTVALLRQVVQASEPARLLIVGTFRDADVSGDHPMAGALAAFHREPNVDRIALRGFDDLDVLEMLETLAGHEMDQQGIALRDALRAETDGNPFFTAEILRHLTETGAIVRQSDGRWIGTVDLASHGLPVSVREVVGQRIARFDERTLRVLRAAAVIGRDFDLELLAAVTDLDIDELLDVLEPVEVSALITSGATDRYSFSHALVGHTLQENMPPARRARLHRSVAEALEVLLGDEPGTRTAELAHHWTQATTPTDSAKAITYAQRAGDYALAHLAPEEARRWYRHAFELVDDADAGTRARLLAGLGDAQRQSGDPDYRHTLLQAGAVAREADDADALVQAALATNRGSISTSAGQVDPDVVALLRDALEVVDGQGSPREALLRSCLAIEVCSGEPEVAFDEAARAVAIAEAIGDPATVAWTAARAAWASRCTIHHDDSRRWAEQALVAARATSDPTRLIESAHQVALTAIADSDLERFDAALAEASAALEQLTIPYYRWTTTIYETMRETFLGDFERAEELAEQAYEIGQTTGAPDALLVFAAQLVAIRVRQGRAHELAEILDAALAQAPLASLVMVRCLAHLEVEEIDEARALLGPDPLALVEDLPRDNLGFLIAVVTLVETIVHLDMSSIAAPLYETLLPYAEISPTNGATIPEPVHYYLGRLATLMGRYDSAEEHLEHAQRLHDRGGGRFGSRARLGIAFLECWIGRAGGGDLDRARQLAPEVLDHARALGNEIAAAHVHAIVEAIDS